MRKRIKGTTWRKYDKSLRSKCVERIYSSKSFNIDLNRYYLKLIYFSAKWRNLKK